MQAILATGPGTSNFDPQFWLNEDRTECRLNDERGNFAFGRGNRSCSGRHLALIETIAFLACLGREVSKIEMSRNEQERQFFIIGDHPTGLPLKLVPRSE
jgi:cytochrome P450